VHLMQPSPDASVRRSGAVFFPSPASP